MLFCKKNNTVRYLKLFTNLGTLGVVLYPLNENKNSGPKNVDIFPHTHIHKHILFPIPISTLKRGL